MTKRSSVLRATAVLLLVAASGVAVIGFGRAPELQPTPAGQTGKSPSLVGEVKFGHEYHFEELKIECPACHHETNAAALRMPHKDYFDDFWIDCTICHKSDKATPADPQSCATCHHRSPAHIADETLSAKVAIHKKCWECHDAGRGEAASKGCVLCHKKAPDKTTVPPASSDSSKKG